MQKIMLRFPRELWGQRDLWFRLTQREVLSRYRGSTLGMAWSVLTPLAMLGVYTFVFSQVFVTRWGRMGEGGPFTFAANLFAGLIVFNFFSECVNRAPLLVISNPNYVKKVIFPLEVLGSVAIGGAIFNAITNLLILMAFQLTISGRLHITALWLPIVLLPLVLGTLACTWLLSAAGVFLRDIGVIISVITNMLMFLSPIFFPLSALPTRFKPLLELNPIAHVIEQTRRIVLYGQNPEASYILTGLVISILGCEMALRCFKRSKSAFADVL